MRLRLAHAAAAADSQCRKFEKFPISLSALSVTAARGELSSSERDL